MSALAEKVDKRQELLARARQLSYELTRECKRAGVTNQELEIQAYKSFQIIRDKCEK